MKEADLAMLAVQITVISSNAYNVDIYALVRVVVHVMVVRRSTAIVNLAPVTLLALPAFTCLLQPKYHCLPLLARQGPCSFYCPYPRVKQRCREVHSTL